MADHGAFYWNELLTGDVGKCKAFFAEVCGWTYDDVPMPNFTYTVAKSGDKMVAGIMDKAKTGAPDMPNHWMAYIGVDDVDAAAAKVAGAGGAVLQDAFDVPNVGRIAIVQDPGGAVIGLMTPS
ncbi:MAG: VOC family protein [Rhodospirillaceae bacterium]|nr:VOC family protein [Rhodospirillaceae bacterium]